MNADEYSNLESVEGEHWYYSGKREIARRWLARARTVTSKDRLLDCGAGTGRFAAEMAALCDVTVLDDHEEALRLLRTRFPAERIIKLEGDRVPLPDGMLEYVTALDVLEHVPDDAGVVRGFHRLLRGGGIALVTVPASMALWSDWDVSLHHYRRYAKDQLRTLFPSSQWEIVYLNYTNVPVFPVVWMVRRWRALFPAKPGATVSRQEDRVPTSWINRLLKASFVIPAFWSIPFPFGVSLILVARKRE
jgi:SAM-dependent methyltransferase